MWAEVMVFQRQSSREQSRKEEEEEVNKGRNGQHRWVDVINFATTQTFPWPTLTKRRSDELRVKETNQPQDNWIAVVKRCAQEIKPTKNLKGSMVERSS